jgi:hypothetical protein
MRYYSFNDYDGDDPSNGHKITTMSEEEIRKEYYPYWYDKMCNKFGKEHVDKNYSFEECLIDWITVHWAWASNE